MEVKKEVRYFIECDEKEMSNLISSVDAYIQECKYAGLVDTSGLKKLLTTLVECSMDKDEANGYLEEIEEVPPTLKKDFKSQFKTGKELDDLLDKLDKASDNEEETYDVAKEENVIPADFYDEFEDYEDESSAYVITAKLPNGNWDYFRVHDHLVYEAELGVGKLVIIPFLDGLYVTEVLSMKSASEMRQATVACMSWAEPFWYAAKYTMIDVSGNDYEEGNIDRTLLIDHDLFREDDMVVYMDEKEKRILAAVNFIFSAPLKENTFYPYARLPK